MIKKLVLAACALSVICLCDASAQNDAIGHLFEGKSPIKVYIIGVKNESGQEQISAEEKKLMLLPVVSLVSIVISFSYPIAASYVLLLAPLLMSITEGWWVAKRDRSRK